MFFYTVHFDHVKRVPGVVLKVHLKNCQSYDRPLLELTLRVSHFYLKEKNISLNYQKYLFTSPKEYCNRK